MLIFLTNLNSILASSFSSIRAIRSSHPPLHCPYQLVDQMAQKAVAQGDHDERETEKSLKVTSSQN